MAMRSLYQNGNFEKTTPSIRRLLLTGSPVGGELRENPGTRKFLSECRNLPNQFAAIVWPSYPLTECLRDKTLSGACPYQDKGNETGGYADLHLSNVSDSCFLAKRRAGVME
ncbi:MAG: hypothetical protein IKG34_00010 [Solobacterium sp.]|nr:hypothetical protein [Solobacterium sp.]